METIEIRQNKKTLIPLLILLTAALFFMTYYVYFSDKFNTNNTIKILTFLSSAMLAYAIYIPTKKFIKNKPVLILTKSGIEINEKGKAVSFLWPQVTHWQIKEGGDDGGTQYLIIETADSKKKVNISWLEKKPNDIKELLQSYKPV